MGGSLGKFVIEGGKKLVGEITVQGAKNAALPLLAAAVMTDEKVTIHNVPDLLDIKNMLKILQNQGVFVEKKGKDVTVVAKGMNSESIGYSLAKELRSSVFLLGAVLAKKKRVVVAYPGGCDIGLRPIDIHLKALRDLSVRVEEKAGYVFCDATEMKCGEVCLDYPSVGATENVMLAATTVKGRTVIYNAAREPEIVELQNFLNSSGAKVSGAGTPKITVYGTDALCGADYTVMPDRIVAGTYLISVVMNGGEVALKGVKRGQLNSLISKLTKNSCNIVWDNDIIYIKADGRPKATDYVSTRPYPGFPTDLQAPFTALQTVSNGTCVLTENIFENRFRHVPELRKMGADIIIRDRTAVIKGVKNLVGAEVYAQDLRGGAALVLAGLAAKGITVVNDVYHIDRGYENIETNFKNIGANITRI